MKLRQKRSALLHSPSENFVMESDELQKIESRLRRIENILYQEKKVDKKPVWVKVGWIRNLTGWKSWRLHEARLQGIIEWRKTPENGIEYNLNSLPDIFIINNPKKAS